MEKYSIAYVTSVDEFFRYYNEGFDSFDIKEEVKPAILIKLKGIGDDRAMWTYARFTKDKKEKFNIASILYNKGYLDSAGLLATCYILGLGVPEDKIKGYEIAKKCHEMGDVQSTFCLAICYRKGYGVVKDIEKCKKLLEYLADNKRYRVAAERIIEYDYEDETDTYSRTFHYAKIASELDSQFGDYQLAFCYYEGHGVKQDYKKAFELFTKLEKKEFIGAYNMIAIMYLKGHYVEENPDKALEYFRKGADGGDAYAQYNLGRKYYEGEIIERNYTKSLYWLKKSAEQDHENAYPYVGNHYFYGYGVPIDYEEAAKWYLKAGETENPLIQNAIGDLYYKGVADIKQDYAKALEYYRAAADSGCKDAQFNYARMLEKGISHSRDIPTAYKYYRYAGYQGHKEAQERANYLKEHEDISSVEGELNFGGLQLNVGIQYYKCKEMLNNYENALLHFKNAENEGNQFAAYYIGECYSLGRGAPQDYDEAIKYYKKHNNVLAACGLGRMYLYGLGVEQDFEKAYKYFTKYTFANYMGNYYLGIMYEKGLYVEKDMKKAFEHYEIPAGVGNPDAVERLKQQDYLDYKHDKQIENTKKKLAEAEDLNQRTQQKVILKYLCDELQDYASCYKCGRYLLKTSDWQDAFKYFEMGADHGYMECAVEVGKYYFEKIQTQDYDKAFKYFSMGAEINDPEANYYLYRCYLEGLGTGINKKEALKCLLLAVDKRDPFAMAAYGIHLLNGDLVPKDLNTAHELLYKAWNSEASDVYQMVCYPLALIYEQKCLYEKAHEFYYKGYNCCDKRCYLPLAKTYMNGVGTKKKKSEAYQILKEGVDDDVADCCYFLAEELYTGKNYPKNHTLSEMLFKKALELGYKEASKPLETYTFVKKWYHSKKL